MNASPDHLAGKADGRVDELVEAARGLETRFSAWQSFGAQPRSLADARVAVEGMARVLASMARGSND